MKEVGTDRFNFINICVNTQSSQTKTNHCSASFGQKFLEQLPPGFSSAEICNNWSQTESQSGGGRRLVKSNKLFQNYSPEFEGPGLVQRSGVPVLTILERWSVSQFCHRTQGGNIPGGQSGESSQSTFLISSPSSTDNSQHLIRSRLSKIVF